MESNLMNSKNRFSTGQYSENFHENFHTVDVILLTYAGCEKIVCDA